MKLQKVKMTLKPLNKIEDFCLKLFDLIGADENVASACVSSVMHGTRFGVDSHGVRLVPHYIKVLETGRLNKNPFIKFQFIFTKIYKTILTPFFQTYSTSKMG